MQSSFGLRCTAVQNKHSRTHAAYNVRCILIGPFSAILYNCMKTYKEQKKQKEKQQHTTNHKLNFIFIVNNKLMIIANDYHCSDLQLSNSLFEHLS